MSCSADREDGLLAQAALHPHDSRCALATAFFGLPPNRVVELGAQIQLSLEPYRPVGLTALSVFFALGTIPRYRQRLLRASRRLVRSHVASQARCVHGARPCGGRGRFMTVVAAACAGSGGRTVDPAAVGSPARCGSPERQPTRRTSPALARGDYRTLIGLPIGGAMLGHSASYRIRGWFRA